MVERFKTVIILSMVICIIKNMNIKQGITREIVSINGPKKTPTDSGKNRENKPTKVAENNIVFSAT